MYLNIEKKLSGTQAKDKCHLHFKNVNHMIYHQISKFYVAFFVQQTFFCSGFTHWNSEKHLLMSYHNPFGLSCWGGWEKNPSQIFFHSIHHFFLGIISDKSYKCFKSLSHHHWTCVGFSSFKYSPEFGTKWETQATVNNKNQICSLWSSLIDGAEGKKKLPCPTTDC